MTNEQSERVIAHYRRGAVDYDKEYDVPFFKEIYDRLTWRYIEPFLPDTGVVLDAGGGTGKWSIPIAKKGLKVVLFDISQDMLNVASAKVRKSGLHDHISFRRGDICNMPFGDNSFDFVLAEGDPISYCRDPDLAVKELGRVLKPNRYLSAGVDSYYYTLNGMLSRPEIDFDKFEKVRREKRFFARDCGFDFWLFTPENLKKLFKKHGFKVIKIAGKPVMFRNRPGSASLLEDPAKARRLIDIEFEFCETASIVGSGGHLHIVAQKKV